VGLIQRHYKTDSFDTMLTDYSSVVIKHKRRIHKTTARNVLGLTTIVCPK